MQESLGRQSGPFPQRRTNDAGAEGRTIPGLRTASTLASLILLFLPFGTAFNASLFNGSIPIAWSQLLIVVLLAHLALSRTRNGPRIRLTTFTAVAGLMIIPVWTSAAPASAAAAYVNFVFGVSGGFVLGHVSSQLPVGRLNRIDLSALCSALIISIQLLLGTINESSDTIHSGATTDLGGSNYLAGILAVLCLATYGRFRASLAPRLAYLILLVPAIAIISILSRGGLVALAVGLTVLLWQRLNGRGPSVLLRRLIIILIPFVVNNALGRIASIRGSGIDINVSVRYELYGLAWRGFVSAPLTGQGWASFRQITLDHVGTPLTFAHNLPLSFLQIGGLVALPTLVIVAKWTFVARRCRPEILPAIIAGIALAMTDPLFEGYAGGLVMWMVLYPGPAYNAKRPVWSAGALRKSEKAYSTNADNAKPMS